jgi:hypothetical protein
MSANTEAVKKLIESLTEAELQSLADYLRSKVPKHPLEDKWGITYELILDAIHRSQDIVQRGVRGVIAEAVFAATVLPALKGWHAVKVEGDLPYDFKIESDPKGRGITIQVKLQRTEAGTPLVRKSFGLDNFVVEVQKTRSGTKRRKKGDAVSAATAPAAPEKTRPYQFGDFDIIAVNMQPATGDWTRFMYTVGSWLIPRAGDKKLIEIIQPVNSKRSDVWTDDLEECVKWFLSGEKKVVFDVEAAKKKLQKQKETQKAFTWKKDRPAQK